MRSLTSRMASQNVVNPSVLCWHVLELLAQLFRISLIGVQTSVGHVFTGGKSVGALSPLSLATSSSVDGNFGMAAFVPSRSMKLGQSKFFWNCSRIGWNPGFF